jgi:hypothetical protein
LKQTTIEGDLAWVGAYLRGGVPLLDESRHELPHNGSTPGISHECPHPPVMPRFPASTPTLIRTMAIRKPKNPIMISTMADQPLVRCPPQRRRAGDHNTDNRMRDEYVGRHNERAFRKRHSIFSKFDLIEQQKIRPLYATNPGSDLPPHPFRKYITCELHTGQVGAIGLWASAFFLSDPLGPHGLRPAS